jgi:NIMA (never in mitosis gene a)-related kinase
MVEVKDTSTEPSEQPAKGEYKKIKTLGKGAFGIAYLVKIKTNQQLAVIKSIDTINMSKKDIRSA